MKPYRLVSLRSLLQTFPEHELSEYLETFVCTRDVDREMFLKKRAIMLEKKSMARTYLAIVDRAIAGYFSLTIKCLRVPEKSAISGTIYSRMNIDSENRVA